MKKAAETLNESRRLSELASYEILDTLPETIYDNVVRLASQICGTPIALVSLVDENRQWFKARVGLEASETPRDVSFCGHAIHQPEIFEIEDACKDPRFHDNPLVTGEPRVRFYAGAPLKTSTGETLGTLCVIDHAPKKLTSDQARALMALAEQVVALIEIRSTSRKLRDATDAKSQFLTNMSHEIRTPLSAILGFADVLADPALGGSDRDRYLQILRKNGRALSRLLDDILDLSKVEANRLAVEKMTFSIRELIDDVVELFSKSLREKALTLEVFFSPDCPEFFHSDPFRLRQILTNLVGNAVKFTEHGEIHLGIRYSDHRLTFEVQDTGIGIATEHFENLFKPFGQADSSTPRNYGGTGLGLYLTRELCTLLGGNLELKESQPGVGTTFTATIQAEPKNLQSANKKKAHEFPAVDLSGCNILLVDDSEDNQILFSVFLKRSGARVGVAENGREGVRQALEGDFDLILMDIEMPVLDGIAAHRELRERGYAKPIIAMTAHSKTTVYSNPKNLPFTDYLPKPITRESLLAAVQRVTEKPLR